MENYFGTPNGKDNAGDAWWERPALIVRSSVPRLDSSPPSFSLPFRQNDDDDHDGPEIENGKAAFTRASCGC